MQKAIRLLLPLCALVLGWIGFNVLSKEEAKPMRPMPEARVIKTKVIELKLQDYQTVITTQGVVRAHNEATLTAQVAGKIKAIADALQDGAFFEEGDVLVEIDPEDFAAGIVTAEAQLARAKAAYSQEEARANQAKLNWEDLGYADEPNELVLRLPQLREAEANVQAAEAGLERAKRDLERTVVRAPFDGRVLRREASMGQSITSGTPLATIFNTEFVEVRLPIASQQLMTLTLPESQDDPPVDVVLTDALNAELGMVWNGKIVGTEGSLDANSLELFVIARVEDPFSRKSVEQRAPLRIGQPVSAMIKGDVIEDVYVIPRTAVRQLSRISIVEPSEKDVKKLVMRKLSIEPIWSNVDDLIVRNEKIADGALLATTRLIYVPEGAAVEIIEDSAEEVTEEATTVGGAKRPDET